MVRVSNIIIGPAWPLVTTGAILAAVRHFDGPVPGWLVIMPFVVLLVYAAALIPIAVWSGYEGTLAMVQQRKRINRDDILRHILEKDAERFARGGNDD